MNDLIKQLREPQVNVHHAEKLCREAADVLEAYAWIPCSERLPEKDGFYIVTMNGDIWGEPDVWESTSCGFYDGKWDEDDAIISAWMPFPNPYTKHDDDDATHSSLSEGWR